MVVVDRTNAPLTLRRATVADARQLALFNQQLIHDEAHDNQASLIDLEQRMTRWLTGLYVVALFERHQPAGRSQVLQQLPPELGHLDPPSGPGEQGCP